MLLETRTFGVMDLIDMENGCWNKNIINTLFILINKNNILQIPLNNMEEDCLKWKARIDGHYFVNAGYYNILEWM